MKKQKRKQWWWLLLPLVFLPYLLPEKYGDAWLELVMPQSRIPSIANPFPTGGLGRSVRVEARSEKQSASVKSPAASTPAALPSAPQPKLLTWRDSRTLLVGYKGAIHLYDVKTRSLGERIVERYEMDSWRKQDCYQPAGGRFYLLLPKPSSAGESPSQPQGQQTVSRVVSNWSKPHRYVDTPKTFSGWETNPLDCQPDDFSLRSARTEEFKKSNRLVQSPGALLLSSVDAAYVSVPKRDWTYERRTLSFFKGADRRPYRELPLVNASGSEYNAITKVNSFRDSDGSYVIYESNSHFDANDSPWPLSGWRLSPDLSTITPLMLPPGPWVTRHGVIKNLGCFSCGCSCYSHFKLTGAQGRIFAHVYGRAVSDSKAGIYELNRSARKPRWQKLVKGNFEEPIALSPDGCRVAYTDGKKTLQVVPTGSCSAL